ncbi:unnamed protein product [Urochloa humidicola]
MSSMVAAAAVDVLPALPPIRVVVSQASLEPASDPACSAALPSTVPTPDAEYVALPGVRERRPLPQVRDALRHQDRDAVLYKVSETTNILTRKRTREQSGEEGIKGTSTNEEDAAFILEPVAPAFLAQISCII